MSKSENQVIAELFFTEFDEKGIKCKCNHCKTWIAKGNGYTNRGNHARSCTKGKLKEELLARNEGKNNLDSFMIDYQPAINVFEIIRFIVEENLPFTIVDRQSFRRICKFEPVCYKTLMKYLEIMKLKMKSVIKQELPDKFGLLLKLLLKP